MVLGDHRFRSGSNARHEAALVKTMPANLRGASALKVILGGRNRDDLCVVPAIGDRRAQKQRIISRCG